MILEDTVSLLVTLVVIGGLVVEVVILVVVVGISKVIVVRSVPKVECQSCLL